MAIAPPLEVGLCPDDVQRGLHANRFSFTFAAKHQLQLISFLKKTFAYQTLYNCLFGLPELNVFTDFSLRHGLRTTTFSQHGRTLLFPSFDWPVLMGDILAKDT